MNLSNGPKSKSLDIVDNNSRLGHMSVTKRILKNGKIVFDVRVQYGTYRVSRTVPTTKTRAKRVEDKILQDLVRGKFDILQKRENPNLKTYAESYETSISWQKSVRRTLISMDHLVKKLGHKRLSEITTQDFIDYRTQRSHQGVGPATINREHACLQRMFNVAIESENYLISKNPLKPIKLFKERPAEDRIITRDEYYRLLEAAPEYFGRIVFFACNTAMRLMEILDLQFKQVRIWFAGAEIELVDTKSGDKEYVPLNQTVVDLLLSMAKERGLDLNNLSEEAKQGYVFTGMRGQRLKSVRKPMITTFRTAGIEYRPFHSFRHFWTSEMFDSGADPATIQKAGRWKDFKTMLRYCHRNKAQTQSAVEKLSTHLKQGRAKIVKLEKNRQEVAI